MILSHTRLPFRHKGELLLFIETITVDFVLATGLSPLLFIFPDNYRLIALLGYFDHLYLTSQLSLLLYLLKYFYSINMF